MRRSRAFPRKCSSQFSKNQCCASFITVRTVRNSSDLVKNGYKLIGTVAIYRYIK